MVRITSLGDCNNPDLIVVRPLLLHVIDHQDGRRALLLFEL